MESDGKAAIAAGRRVYAVGDIHGRADLLAEMQRRIVSDARTAEDREKVLVYLGDYVDRGPDSFSVLDRLIYGRLPGFTEIHLKGNHEDMLLAFLGGAPTTTWLLNGADATLESYGVVLDDWPMTTADLALLRAQFAAAIPAHHLEFLNRLSLLHRDGDYVFVHAGIRPGRSLDLQSERDLIWIREPFLSNQTDPGFKVVHGHTIVEHPYFGPTRIGIDTGAYFTGRLTCLVLEGADVRILRP